MITTVIIKLSRFNPLKKWPLSMLKRHYFSAIALIALGISQSPLADEDLKHWLQNKGLNNQANPTEFYYVSANISNQFNSPNFGMGVPTGEINGHEFKQSTKKIAKVNEKKLLRILSDKLKISLFKASHHRSGHKVYINTLKQELVGQSYVGKARYEVRVSKKQAEAHFLYAFN